MQNQRGKSLTHLPALDGLRGLAVLMVVFYHVARGPGGADLAPGLTALRDALWCGVDLFFVLSGYLITRILLATLDSPAYFRSFYARRTLRIFPLYYGVLVGLFVVLPLGAWLLGGPLASVTASDNYQTLWRNQLWPWTYTQNLLQAGGPSRLPGMGHFWSLAIEEQFYLVWPAAAWLVGRRGLAALSLAVLLAAPCLRWLLLAQGGEPWAVFHWTLTRCDTLAWGALAAVVGAAPRRWLVGGFSVGAAGWLLSGAAAGSMAKLGGPMQVAGYSAVALAFAALVLLLAGAGEASRAARCFRAGWLRYLGRLSYGIYVFHWPVCRGVEAAAARLGFTGGDPSVYALAQAAAVLAISLALAWASWHAWEKHWLRLKGRFPYWPRGGTREEA